ncbi:AraC-like DNA-binding protein [Methylobacterium sp. R2-1]|nr:AraC-like DNA-binding protein [Methylobacterium sp. R2-1]
MGPKEPRSSVLSLEEEAVTVGTGQGLTDLSLNLVFSTPAHFPRFFRDHVGVPPSVFRNIVLRGALPLA